MREAEWIHSFLMFPLSQALCLPLFLALVEKQPKRVSGESLTGPYGDGKSLCSLLVEDLKAASRCDDEG